MSIIAEQQAPVERSKKILIRRDSKDSCFSEEMAEDLSVTAIDESNRLSPMATLSPISRKSSGGDSGIDYDTGLSEGELSRVSTFLILLLLIVDHKLLNIILFDGRINSFLFFFLKENSFKKTANAKSSSSSNYNRCVLIQFA